MKNRWPIKKCCKWCGELENGGFDYHTSCLVKKFEFDKKELAKRTEPLRNDAIKSNFGMYVSNASNRGHSFELEPEYFETLLYMPCYYCGSKPKRLLNKIRKGVGGKIGGIDRVNNLEGYTKDNCVPCCKVCNYKKSNHTLVSTQNELTKLHREIQFFQKVEQAIQLAYQKQLTLIKN